MLQRRAVLCLRPLPSAAKRERLARYCAANATQAGPKRAAATHPTQ
jgi:hypothetical protein